MILKGPVPCTFLVQYSDLHNAKNARLVKEVGQVFVHIKWTEGWGVIAQLYLHGKPVQKHSMIKKLDVTKPLCQTKIMNCELAEAWKSTENFPEN